MPRNTPKTQIETSPIYSELYYLYLYKRLKEGFYQKRGFIVNPKAKIKTSIEVVFPNVKSILNEHVILGKTFDYHNELKSFPMLLGVQQYEKLKLKKWGDFGDKLYKEPDPKKLKELRQILNTHESDIFDFLSEINPLMKNYAIRILPVTFGTRVSFFNNAKEKELLVTWRHDLPNSIAHVLEGIVSETVVLEANKDDFKLFEDVMGWYEREAICDFLTISLLKKLKLTKFVKDFNGTVSSLKVAKTALSQNNDYLLKIGLNATKPSSQRNIKIQERLLRINDKQVFLTEMETRFMNTVLRNAPYAATFDEIAENMWGSDSDKFSLYAISRTQANIRMKLRSMGHEDLLLTIRGKGVAINTNHIVT